MAVAACVERLAGLGIEFAAVEADVKQSFEPAGERAPWC
jgi:hypothetical protein